MSDTATPSGFPPRWVHAWAVLTALVTLPLLLLGAEVTTKQVGMVDPEWPTPPWQLWLTGWRDSGLGFLIEHGHRLAGYTVGVCVIVLTLALWFTEPRRWMRWLGVAALLGVITQGVLGGMRVRLNALLGPDLALIHGVFGQMVFALLVTLAVCTSRRWAETSERLPPEDTVGMRRWSLVVVGLLLLQLVLGAILRHKGTPLGTRGHLLIAFAVVGSVVWLAREAWLGRGAAAHLQASVRVLAILIAIQVLLGVEAWVTRFSQPATLAAQPQALGRDLVRSAHVVVGSLVLAAGVAASLQAHRHTLWAAKPAPVPLGRLEGAV